MSFVFDNRGDKEEYNLLKNNIPWTFAITNHLPCPTPSLAVPFPRVPFLSRFRCSDLKKIIDRRPHGKNHYRMGTMDLESSNRM
jgi:hypothetical protein